MIAMDFKSLAHINFIATIIGGGIGISMAYTHWGVWSLVGQTLASTLAMFFYFLYILVGSHNGCFLYIHLKLYLGLDRNYLRQE